MILFDSRGVQSIYNKQRPVPLAEQVPLSETFPVLSSINLGVANYSSGKKDVLFDLGDYKFSSLICYESIFPEINRRHVNKGADFITFLVISLKMLSMTNILKHKFILIFLTIFLKKFIDGIVVPVILL